MHDPQGARIYGSSTVSAKMPHLAALDGWRGISILLVVAAHMLPLGPKSLQLNGAIAATGMAIFFTLSGFLITSTLLFDPDVRRFLIRRLCRILPLAWLYTLMVLPFANASPAAYCAQLLFYTNIPPYWLNHLNGHLWSLGVEMQFYSGVAALCLLLGRRGLSLLPVLCLLVTALRIFQGVTISIVTWYRVDEILAGGTLALMTHLPSWERVRRLLLPINPCVWMVLLVAASHERVYWLQFLRPYIAASLVGCTLVRVRPRVSRVLGSGVLRYTAHISYALYVLHPLTMAGWLGEGATRIRYAKRILSFGLSFLGAHLSTNYYERYWIGMGKRWTAGRSKPKELAASLQVAR